MAMNCEGKIVEMKHPSCEAEEAGACLSVVVIIVAGHEQVVLLEEAGDVLADPRPRCHARSRGRHHLAQCRQGGLEGRRSDGVGVREHSLCLGRVRQATARHWGQQDPHQHPHGGIFQVLCLVSAF